MPMPVIKAVTSEEKLLVNINLIQQTLQSQISPAAAEAKVLYDCNTQYLLENFSEVLSSERTVNQKKERLKQLLAERWHAIKRSPAYCYCERPRDPLNQLCWAIALYIAPLPKVLADCDNWEVGQGPYFLLMPDLEACSDITGTNIHQYQLQEFILSADYKRYIPIVETLDYFFKSTSQKPFYGVFSPSEMADVTFDKKQVHLIDEEIQRLTHHSPLTMKIMENIAILKNPNGSFFNKLNQLADGLLVGSSHGNGVGSGYNAAAQANVAIVNFFEYWDGLTKASKEYYLHKVPMLKGIFQRLRDPVSIGKQGVEYCVGLTGGDLRHEASLHRSTFQNYHSNELQGAIQTLIAKLEKKINRFDYPLNELETKIQPNVCQLIKIPAKEQGRLIKQYLHLDYPNFLFFVFDRQPAMVSTFIQAFKSSEYKHQMMQQRSKNGMSLLMIAAQSYTETLSVLLASCLELTNAEINDELITETPTGESLFVLIIQQRPGLLARLLVAIAKLTKNDQLRLFAGKDGDNSNTLRMIMENYPDEFLQVCDLLKTFSVPDIEKIFDHRDAKGNTLLMAALLNYSYAVTPLMILFTQCKETIQKKWIAYRNSGGLTLFDMALNAEYEVFQTFLKVAVSSQLSLENSFFSGEKSFLLKASQGRAEHFNAALMLLDSFSLEEQRFILQERDSLNNHLLLLTMFHQSTPPALLFTKLKLLSKPQLYNVLCTNNEESAAPLIVSLKQCPQYFVNIVELLSALPSDQQDILWQQVDANGYSLLLLVSIYAPEHLEYVLSQVSEATLFEALKQTDFNGNSFLALIASSQPQFLPFFIKVIKTLSAEQRFLLLSALNHQGDNLFSWMLQQDTSLFHYLFELMTGFTIAQQLSLLTHRNHKNQHALMTAYGQGIERFDQVLQSVDTLNACKKDIVLTQLPLPHWFDLLSRACVNTAVFRRLYKFYQRMHTNNEQYLSNLLSYCDTNNNNLLMIILRNNPKLISRMVRDIKELSDVKVQRQIMLHKNAQEETVLSLFEKNTSGQIIIPIQSFLKRLDKQSTKQMMLKTTMKMHSDNMLVSPEMLENCNAEELYNKLNSRDAQGNNLLAQIMMRVPLHLPAVIEKMQRLLSSVQISELLGHANQKGINCYWLALEQNQTTYRHDQIQSLAQRLDNESLMDLLISPDGQSVIEFALNHSKDAFINVMRFIDVANSEKSKKMMEEFWWLKSENLKTLIDEGNVDICERLISTTRTMSLDSVTELMHRNQSGLIAALTRNNKSMKGLIWRWLFSIPSANRFKFFLEFSSETLLVLLNDKKIDLIDTLSLKQLAELLTLCDNEGHNLLVQALVKGSSCREKLINRFPLFTSQQQAALFKTKDGNTSLLYLMKEKYPSLFQTLLTRLSMLSSDMQFTLFRHVDRSGSTILNHLQDTAHLYEQLLDMFSNLDLKYQIQLFLQQMELKQTCLLVNSPRLVKKGIVEQFIKFPQNAKVEILLAMDQADKNSLRRLLETLPDLQDHLLQVIQSLPTPVQGALVSPGETFRESLIHWLINKPDNSMKKKGMLLMSGLAKNDLYIILRSKNQRDDNLLQDIARNQPSLFPAVFSIFMSLSDDSKTALLLMKNTNDRNLFNDLLAYKRYDHFEILCEAISKLPNGKKVAILTASDIIPMTSTTRWVRLVYGAPRGRALVKLLNDKSVFEPMYHLLLSLAPETQMTILTNTSNLGRTVIDEVKEPEQAKLRLLIKHAHALLKIKKLLDKIAEKITNEQIFGPIYALRQQLLDRLDFYQSIYQKSKRHINDLAEGLISDIEAVLPFMPTRLTASNRITSCLKLASSVIIFPYGGYNLYKKATTSRHVFFRTDEQKILYDIEDLGAEFKRIASAFYGAHLMNHSIR